MNDSCVFHKPPSLSSPSCHSSLPLVHLFLRFIPQPGCIQLLTVTSESPGGHSREREGMISPFSLREDEEAPVNEEGGSQGAHVWALVQTTQLKWKLKPVLFWLQELHPPDCQQL